MDTTLIRKEVVAEGTECFFLAKPEGFSYKAGQSIDLTIPDPKEMGERADMHPFSLSSAPGEAELAITTRMRDSAFKRNLRSLSENARLTLEGPFGDLMLHENTQKRAVMLAGGIGITPFYSMIKDARARALPHRLTLFYSNRRPEDAPFLDELSHLASATFTFVPTMTDLEASSRTWDGERGYIDEVMLRRHLDLAEPAIYYLAGPAKMVVAMRALLTTAGISNDDIRTEEFTGY